MVDMVDTPSPLVEFKKFNNRTMNILKTVHPITWIVLSSCIHIAISSNYTLICEVDIRYRLTSDFLTQVPWQHCTHHVFDFVSIREGDERHDYYYSGVRSNHFRLIRERNPDIKFLQAFNADWFDDKSNDTKIRRLTSDHGVNLIFQDIVNVTNDVQERYPETCQGIVVSHIRLLSMTEETLARLTKLLDMLRQHYQREIPDFIIAATVCPKFRDARSLKTQRPYILEISKHVDYMFIKIGQGGVDYVEEWISVDRVKELVDDQVEKSKVILEVTLRPRPLEWSSLYKNWDKYKKAKLDKITYQDVCTNLTELKWKRGFNNMTGVPNVSFFSEALDRVVSLIIDDHESARFKINYLKEHGYGGILVSNIANDDFKQACGKGRSPLVSFVHNVLAGYPIIYELQEEVPQNIFQYAMIGGAVFFILIGLSILTLIYCKKMRKGKLSSRHPRTRSVAVETNAYHFTESVVSVKENSQEELQVFFDSHVWDDLKAQGKIIPRDDFELVRELGHGHFGCVYEGIVWDGSLNKGTRVAVKTLMTQGKLESRDIDNFIREAIAMKELNHPHILPLLGLSFEDMSPLIILPFMENGALYNYLKDGNTHVILRDLIKFGVQIAQGMEYLSGQKFVHRDLAARNCMLDDRHQVKVADFGLARDVYEEGFYTTKEAKELPLRWMAPECLSSQKFTVMSDVWSFGVVLWELTTRCHFPYDTVNQEDLLDYLKDGFRLPQPIVCPDEIYLVMSHCWAWREEDRPSFTEIIGLIDNATQAIIEYSQTRIPSVATYYNVL